MKNLIGEFFSWALKPRPKRHPWQWAEEKLTLDKTSPFPGRYKADTAPWTKLPMEKWADPEIRYIIIRCPAQTGKTQLAIVCVCYAIDEDPGPMMWVMAAADEAKTFSKQRLTPTLESVDSIASQMPRGRSDKMVCEINFPQSPLVINGANSPSKLQSKPIRRLILDEVRNYPPGALSMALKRIRSWWNGCALIISTGDSVGDPFDLEWQKGTQSQFCVKMPCCGALDPMDFKNLKWDDNDITRPDGEWKMDAVAKTIRYECPNCKAQMRDLYPDRRKACLDGEWKHNNPNAASNTWSGTWTALIVPWISFASIVEEFLAAKKALDMGVVDPLKTFITETLGLSWEEQETAADDFTEPTNYNPNEPWEKEHFRFMTVDVQRDHFWFVVRSWAIDGDSRLLDEGMVRFKEDLEDRQRKWDISHSNVIVDAGYDDDANFVFQMCADRGWTAYRGDDRKSFRHRLDDGTVVLRPYSPEMSWDPGMGRSSQGLIQVRLFYWSNPTIKDVTFRLKTGKGAKWEVYSTVSIEYRNQMCSESKRRLRTKSGKTIVKWERIGRRPNHLWDCENMQTTTAFQSGLIINPFGDPVPEDSKES